MEPLILLYWYSYLFLHYMIETEVIKHLDKKELPPNPDYPELTAGTKSNLHRTDGAFFADPNTIGQDMPGVRRDNESIPEALQQLEQVISTTPPTYEAALQQRTKLLDVIKRFKIKDLLPQNTPNSVELGDDRQIHHDLLLQLLDQSAQNLPNGAIDKMLDAEVRLTGGDQDRRWRMYQALQRDSQVIAPAYRDICTNIDRKLQVAVIDESTIGQEVEEQMKNMRLDTLTEEEQKVLQAEANKKALELSREYVAASEITKMALPALTNNPENRHNEQILITQIQSNLDQYRANHPEITDKQAKHIIEVAKEAVAKKLTVQALTEQNQKTPFIKKISVEPTQQPRGKSYEVPIQIGDTGRTESATAEIQKPQINVDAAVADITHRLQTDSPRDIETEETRLFREQNHHNPEAVAPLHHETREEMIRRHIDTYIMNQQEGTANSETRAAIEARVNEGITNRIARQAMPAPEAPTPPTEPPVEPPKNPILSADLLKLSQQLAAITASEVQQGNQNPVDEIIERKIAVFEAVHGPIDPTNRLTITREIRNRTTAVARPQPRVAQGTTAPIEQPQKKEGLLRTYWKMLTGK